MQLHDLKPARGAHRRPERVGRGTGSGRGQKGQNAPSEGFRVGFEGGQMPLAQRIPKLPGFKNPFKKIYSVVNLSKLSRFKDGSKVDVVTLVEPHWFSASARDAIEKVGGSVKVLGEKRTIGPRRTAAKLPKPLPTAETPKAAAAPAEAAATRPERQKKGAPATTVEEATPPDES